ncbi:TIGR04219 family outer membrane beta-barrel protein [Sulfurimonas sp.]|uniref:TIGR04219 family outer membrane beta-barrel protein n=1 Tax=Sulfurimonas sp. TaxID=2022749 RepID=UPI00356A678C
MKKIFTALTCAGLMATVASADIARVEMGVGAWAQKSSGKISYTDNGANGAYTSSEKDVSQLYVWALIKHPVPVVPNLRLEYVALEDKGTATGQFKDFNIGGVSTTMAYDMKQYDIIPYYNILDNTAWITLDLGLDIKVVEATYNAAPQTPFTGYNGSETIALPLLYIRGRVEIPATNIGIEADVKYVTYSSSTVYDARAKIDYTLDFIPVIQPAIEVGYRVQKIDLADDSSLKVDLEFSGVYAGLMLRF